MQYVDKSLVLRRIFSSSGSVCNPQLEDGPATLTSPEYFFKGHHVWGGVIIQNNGFMVVYLSRFNIFLNIRDKL